jgi:iron complex outermembrane receptor protein
LSDRTNLRLNIISGKEKTYQSWYGVMEKDLKTNRTINYSGTEKTGEPYKNETDNYRQDHYQLFFDRKLSTPLTFTTALFYVKGKGFYEQYKAQQNYSDYLMPNAVSGTDTLYTTDVVRQLWLDNDFYGNIFSLQYAAPKRILIFGGAITKYTGNHFGKVVWAENGLTADKKWYDNDAVKNDFTFYSKLHQNLTDAFLMFIDLQGRTVKYDIKGFRNNPELEMKNKYVFFNPKIGFTWSVNKWMSFVSASIANKEPNRDDYEAAQNEIPKPERLFDVETGIERKHKGQLYAATFYYMKYKNQLALTGKINDVGAYTRSNINKSYRLGIELQTALTVNKWIQYSANLTLSRNKIFDFTEFIDDYDNGGQRMNQYKKTDISFSPAVTASATITLKPAKNLEINFLSKYVGKQYLDNTQNDQRKLNPFFTEDIRVIFSASKKWLKDVSLTAQVNNVLNEMYEPNGYTYSYYYNDNLTTENYFYPMAGINWMVGLNVRF